MSPSKSASAALATALPCAACGQPVTEKRSADGALVVLDAATKRLHLCVKRKELEAAKAKRAKLVRPVPPRPTRQFPPAKRAARPPLAGAPHMAPETAERAPHGALQKAPHRAQGKAPHRAQQKAANKTPNKTPPRRRPKKPTLRSPQQVEEILKGRIVRWRTSADGPTSFCAECAAPVLVGFSHARWDVMMLDAAGHRPHDCETSRLAAAALHRERLALPVELPDLPARAGRARRIVPPVPPVLPIAQSAPAVPVAPRPRRRPAGSTARVAAANTCETCGKLKAVVAGEWVCLHCGA